MRTAQEIAEGIKDSQTWDFDDCAELCKLAGLEKEWKESTACWIDVFENDGKKYDFEQVLEIAAKILGVEIY